MDFSDRSEKSQSTAGNGAFVEEEVLMSSEGVHHSPSQLLQASAKPSIGDLSAGRQILSNLRNSDELQKKYTLGHSSSLPRSFLVQDSVQEGFCGQARFTSAESQGLIETRSIGRLPFPFSQIMHTAPLPKFPVAISDSASLLGFNSCTPASVGFHRGDSASFGLDRSISASLGSIRSDYATLGLNRGASASLELNRGTAPNLGFNYSSSTSLGFHRANTSQISLPLQNSDICNKCFMPGGNHAPRCPKLFLGHEERERFKIQEEEALDGDIGLAYEDLHASTFIDYQPAKLARISCLKPHASAVTETSTLAATVLPELTYKVHLPKATMLEGKLSSLQLETVIKKTSYIKFRNSGPGVGKGRQIAGILFENFILKRQKALWISISADLIDDARRDLKDIGAGCIPVHDLRSFKNDSKLSSIHTIKEGVMFLTYSLLVSGGQKDKSTSRLNQIVEWCGGPTFEGVIALDECHKAKNLKETKIVDDEEKRQSSGKAASSDVKVGSQTATAVCQLQDMLPNARVVYVSATGASSPEHLKYAGRLGLWGAGTSFKDARVFVDDIKEGGVGAMELLAMEMKGAGQYLARTLSFHGVTFETVDLALSDSKKVQYDLAVRFWTDFKKDFDASLERFSVSIESAQSSSPTVGGMEMKSRKKCLTTKRRLFWSTHQRFWQHMCMAAKVDGTVLTAKEALKAGKCIVIGLQNTGESVSSTLEAEEDCDQITSTTSGLLRAFIADHCGFLPNQDFWISRAEDLDLPLNPLDELIDELGGPEKVAELTGRSGRHVRRHGRWIWERRCKVGSDTKNIAERKAFMDGVKLIAIISEAASTGISLHADKRAKNTRVRVHITLQLPWSADKAVQQMGRSHRSNQSNLPEFKLLMTNLGGEWRFASAVASRLQSLGALTHGDRRAVGGSSIQNFAVEDKYGMRALEKLFDCIEKQRYALDDPDFISDPLFNYHGSFENFAKVARDALSNAGIDRKLKPIQFLNRLLGIEVDLQNHIFHVWHDFMDLCIGEDKSKGRYQECILDIAVGSAAEIQEENVLYRNKRTNASTSLFKIVADRGISWSTAIDMLNDQLKSAQKKEIKFAGFYRDHSSTFHHGSDILLAVKQKDFSARSGRPYLEYRPNTGTLRPRPRQHTERELKHYTRITDLEEAKAMWTEAYEFFESNCGHTRACGRADCVFKKRTIPYYVLSGSVLPFWSALKSLEHSGERMNMKVVRARVTNGRTIIGLQIPTKLTDNVTRVISAGQSFHVEPDNPKIDFSRLSNFRRIAADPRKVKIKRALKASMSESTINDQTDDDDDTLEEIEAEAEGTPGKKSDEISFGVEDSDLSSLNEIWQLDAEAEILIDRLSDMKTNIRAEKLPWNHALEANDDTESDSDEDRAISSLKVSNKGPRKELLLEADKNRQGASALMIDKAIVDQRSKIRIKSCAREWMKDRASVFLQTLLSRDELSNTMSEASVKKAIRTWIPFGKFAGGLGEKLRSSMTSPFKISFAAFKREIRQKHPSCKYEMLKKLDSRGVQRCHDIFGIFSQGLVQQIFLTASNSGVCFLDADWLESEDGFKCHLREISLRRLLGYPDLHHDESMHGGSDPAKRRLQDLEILKQSDNQEQYGIIVDEDWRNSKGFRLFELVVSDNSGRLVKGLEWTPGSDVNPGRISLVGQQRFSIRSKHSKWIDVHNHSWYPVRVLRQLEFIRGREKSFLRIFDECESVENAYQKLAGKSFRELGVDLSYRLCDSHPIVTVDCKEESDRVLARSSSTDSDRAVGNDLYESRPKGPRNSFPSDTESEADSDESNDSDSSEVSSEKIDLGETETESENSDEFSDEDEAFRILEKSSKMHVDAKAVSCEEPCSTEVKSLHCRDPCKFERKWNGFSYSIQCSSCKVWFHGCCVGVKKGHVGKRDTWVCSPDCEDDLPLCGRITTIICGSTVKSNTQQKKVSSSGKRSTVGETRRLKNQAASNYKNLDREISKSKSINKNSKAATQARMNNSNDIALTSERLVIVQASDENVPTKRCSLDSCDFQPNSDACINMIGCAFCKNLYHSVCVQKHSEGIFEGTSWTCSDSCKFKLSSFQLPSYTEKGSKESRIQGIDKLVEIANSEIRTLPEGTRELCFKKPIVSCVENCQFIDGEARDDLIECAVCKRNFHSRCFNAPNNVLSKDVIWVCDVNCEDDLPMEARRRDVHLVNQKAVGANFSKGVVSPRSCSHENAKKRQRTPKNNEAVHFLSRGSKIEKSYCLPNCKYGRQEGEAFMIECTNCKQWFHGECVHVLEDSVPDDTAWACTSSCAAALSADLPRHKTIFSGSNAQDPVSTTSNINDQAKKKSSDNLSDTVSNGGRTEALVCPDQFVLDSVLASIVGSQVSSHIKVMSAVLDYIKSRELFEPLDQSYVKLDDTLRSIVGGDAARCKLSKIAKATTKRLKRSKEKCDRTPEIVPQAKACSEVEPCEKRFKCRLDLSFEEHVGLFSAERDHEPTAFPSSSNEFNGKSLISDLGEFELASEQNCPAGKDFLVDVETLGVSGLTNNGRSVSKECFSNKRKPSETDAIHDSLEKKVRIETFETTSDGHPVYAGIAETVSQSSQQSLHIIQPRCLNANPLVSLPVSLQEEPLFCEKALLTTDPQRAITDLPHSHSGATDFDECDLDEDDIRFIEAMEQGLLGDNQQVTVATQNLASCASRPVTLDIKAALPVEKSLTFKATIDSTEENRNRSGILGKDGTGAISQGITEDDDIDIELLEQLEAMC